MNYRRLVLVFASVLAVAAIAAVPVLRAGEQDQLSKFQFSFSKPVEVPGHVLPPGTYWFTIKDAQGAKSDAEKNIIAIYNEDRTKLIADIPARPAQRKNDGYRAAPGTDTDVVELYIAPGNTNRPATLLKWFYPGTYTGHQFVYSDKDQSRIDEETKESIVIKGHKGSNGDYAVKYED